MAITINHFKFVKFFSVTFKNPATTAPIWSPIIPDKLLIDIIRAKRDPSHPSLHLFAVYTISGIIINWKLNVSTTPSHNTNQNS